MSQTLLERQLDRKAQHRRLHGLLSVSRYLTGGDKQEGRGVSEPSDADFLGLELTGLERAAGKRQSGGGCASRQAVMVSAPTPRGIGLPDLLSPRCSYTDQRPGIRPCWVAWELRCLPARFSHPPGDAYLRKPGLLKMGPCSGPDILPFVSLPRHLSTWDAFLSLEILLCPQKTSAITHQRSGLISRWEQPGWPGDWPRALSGSLSLQEELQVHLHLQDR